MRSALLRAGVGIAAMAALGCGNPSGLPHFNTNGITVTDDQFVPAVDTVLASQNVTWSFPSTISNIHNITWISTPPGSTPANSLDRMPGSSPYIQYVSQAGTYTYYCTHHGSTDGSGMFGTLVVCQQMDATGAFTGCS